MTETDILLVQLMEEASEVQKECAKALRFGLDDHYPEDPEKRSNRQRIEAELRDLYTVVDILSEKGVLKPSYTVGHMVQKHAKIAKYLDLSRRLGRIVDLSGVRAIAKRIIAWCDPMALPDGDNKEKDLRAFAASLDLCAVCGCDGEECRGIWPSQRKCCPDCTHD